MAIIATPVGLAFSRFRIGHRRYDYEEISDVQGDISGRIGGSPRWVLSIASPNRMVEAQAKLWRATMMKLRGRINHLAAYDIVRPAPLGTMRGTLTLSSSAAQGDTSIIVTGGAGQAGTTMAQGDWLQIGAAGLGSQYVMVQDDATANGSGIITLNIEHPLRVAYAAGQPVTWDKPLCYYKAVNETNDWDYDAGSLTVSGFEGDFVEQWT